MNKLLIAALAVSLLSACSETGIDSQQNPSQPSNKVGNETSIWPKMTSPIPVDEALEQSISDLMAQMHLEDKIGQMIQGEIRSVTPEDVKKYRLGSVLNGGGTRPNNDKYATPQDWVELADAYYHASMDTSDGGVAIPIIWGTDAVHGHNNVIGATLFPHNIGLGAAKDPDLIKRIAEITAKEVAVTGIDWIFAPTVAVVQNDRWGRTYESYSENPDIVGAYAAKIVEGLQGTVGTDQFLDENHAISTAKHFLGDGGTSDGIDQGDNIASEQVMLDIHAAGYLTALPAGVQSVMASYNSWNKEKLHGHKYLLTDVLKQQLGFDGFIVGDWNGHGQVAGCDNTSCAASINAGLDMFMVPQDWKALYENTLAQAKSGEIPISRIDDAVRRILRVKFRAGLFEKGAPSTRPSAGKVELIGSADHRAVARDAARQSLVLLKNDSQVLPLKPNQTVAVVGDAANNMGKQTGGWTISWQGNGNTNKDFPGATTIYAGIEAVVSRAGGTVIFSEDGSNIETADVVISVFGEKPYAEMHGDVTTLEYQPGNKIDLAILDKFKQKNIPVISVFISGRPLWVNPELNRSNAFVAAWLPGSEGSAIADVLFTKENGEINFDFTGKLPFSWPKTPDQQLNFHGPKSPESKYDPLFAWGYGLNYSSASTIGNNLDENGQAPSPSAVESVVLYDGEPQVPWQLFLQEQGDNSIKIRSDKQAGLFHTVVVSSIADKPGFRSIHWTGEREAKVYLAVNSPINFSSYSNGMVEFSARVDTTLNSDIDLVMSCGDDCGSTVNINTFLTSAPINTWQTLSVALNCFSQQAMELEQVLTGFGISTDQQAGLSFGDVSLQKNGAESAAINCSE